MKDRGVAEQWQWLGCDDRGSVPAAVSTVAVPTTPLFSKKLSSSSSAASLDTSTPEPLPGKVTPQSWSCPWSLPALDVLLCSRARREEETARKPDSGGCQADPCHGRHPHGAGERGHADHHRPCCHAGPRGTAWGMLGRLWCSPQRTELLPQSARVHTEGVQAQ